MRPIHTNKLVYPPAAMKEGRGGTVEVGVLVDEHGKTSKPYVAKSDAAKDLQQAALNSMEGCRLPVIKENDRAISYVYVVPIAFSMDSTADRPAVGPQGLTLAVVVSDAKYLKQILRPKTIICQIERMEEVPPEVTKAIKDANLSEVTQLFPLPAGATPLKRDKTIAPKYPDELYRNGVPGQGFFPGVRWGGRKGSRALLLPSQSYRLCRGLRRSAARVEVQARQNWRYRNSCAHRPSVVV